MSNLINDGSLIGFWPLSEASGAPLFKNYSPAYAKHPSGISFDMHVATANVSNQNIMMSTWPGTDEQSEPASGTSYTGYRAQGTWIFQPSITGEDSSPYSRYLLLGGGTRACAEKIWQPAIVGSGFTAGIWIYPTSDGFLSAASSDGFTAPTENWVTGYSRCHTLYGAFAPDSDGDGWRIGVSGALDRAAQFNFDEESGNQLRAYVALETTGFTASDTLSTAIEAGRYTHIAITFDYVDGVSNVLSLYKDGILEDSLTTNDDLTNSNIALLSSTLHRTLTIGGIDDNTTANGDRYDRTGGWNNMVSGVYFFQRVLSAGEMDTIHGCGGLQPDENVLLDTTEVSITDTNLLGYYPYIEPGFADVSRHHRPLIANEDLGDAGGKIFTPGPFGGGGCYNNATGGSYYCAASSGLCNDIITSRNWTIGTWYSVQNSAERDDNMILSWGSVTSTTNATFLPAAISTNSAGIVATVSGITNNHKVVIEAYSIGDPLETDSVLVLECPATIEHYQDSVYHLAIAYDDATKGIAAYINGALQSSGILPHSLTDQLGRVTGSGYPLMFGNGITDTIADSAAKNIHGGGGLDNWLGPQVIMGRPLLPAEIRHIVVNGINYSSVLNSRHDPRLVGYWPCDSFNIGDIVVQDEARCWSPVPMPLSRTDTFAKQERWYDRDHNEVAGTIFNELGVARYDQFATRTISDPLQLTFGNLGITSGVFSVRGGGMGTAVISDALNTRSSIGNLALRIKPTFEEIDLSCQNIGEYIIAFEVTPSGNIPALHAPATASNAKKLFNSTCSVYGNTGEGGGTNDGEIRSFLTSVNAPAGSGISIMFASRTGAFSAVNTIPLVSGNLTFGVPSKVLFHGKFENPYRILDVTAGQAEYTFSLWIDGQRVQSRTIPVLDSKLWSTGTPDTNDHWLLQFGGDTADDAYATQMDTFDAGLGDIYMREIFLMRGPFYTEEVEAIATSGIKAVSVTGFINQPPTTQVSILDSDLVGYYRFNGFEGGGSGTTDLSLNNNHLFGAAQSLLEDSVTATQAAVFLRAIPGPLAESDLGIQCSGFTYSSRAFTNNADNRVAPFMASGVDFNSPNAGFSVGFFHIKKEAVLSNRFDTLVSYGMTPTVVSNTSTDVDFGWVIGQDASENMKMVISTEGNMYLDNVSNAAQAGQVVAGSFGDSLTIYDDLRNFEQHFAGNQRLPRLDNWAHYCWTYDASTSGVRHYVNGELVDVKTIHGGSNPQVPSTPDARYLTFYQHSSNPWNFDTPNINNHTSVMTDFFYFKDALTPEEVRYIALNGIDSATGTIASGHFGGFVHGQDTGSGLIGGYQQGLDTGSGLLGGYIPGGMLGSGLVGGFVSGIVFGTGTIGGFVQGLDIVSGVLAGYIHGVEVGSGLIAGYIQGLEVGSGLVGGLVLGGSASSGVIGGFVKGSEVGSGLLGAFVLGGLQGSFDFDAGFTVEVMAGKDFDAQLEIAKTVNADFDAKLVVFQDEAPPDVAITIPGQTITGLVPPFNQYFIGKASGLQGKSIDNVVWKFGDFTAPVTVAESGSNCYPIQHHFAGSGLYLVKFTATDSDGLSSSAIRIINAASGVNPVHISVSGTPRSGSTALIVDFSTKIETLPPNVSVVSQLLDFDDGQSSIAFNPSHSYQSPGTMRPIWCIKDSRGVIWCDSLEGGSNT